MSVHPSLKTKGASQTARNVLKRIERIKKLTAEGRMTSGQKIWGLPKTKPEL